MKKARQCVGEKRCVFPAQQSRVITVEEHRCSVTGLIWKGGKSTERNVASLCCSSVTGSNGNAFPSSSKGLTAEGLKACGNAGVVSPWENTVLQFFKNKKRKRGKEVSCSVKFVTCWCLILMISASAVVWCARLTWLLLFGF